mgnify:FL=1
MLVNKKKKLAIIVAHPDDEVLGFGGTIAKHTSAGISAHLLIMATGLGARKKSGIAKKKEVDRLKKQTVEASKILGIKTVNFCNFPDNQMDTISMLKIIKKIESFIKKFQPSTILTHYNNDLNIDHAICSKAVVTACRPLPKSCVEAIYFGEVVSSSEYTGPDDRFAPQVYVNIERELAIKCMALKSYKEEMRSWPHPRSIKGIKHLAGSRGSECGLKAAEAFHTFRKIYKSLSK